MVGKNVTGSVLGIPSSWANVTERQVLWEKSADVNGDYRISAHPTSNSSDLVVQLKFDYTERIFTI